jgi:dephospho-CoA kinase
MIIGITGTNGAGKGTVVDYLVKQKGFTHYSARDFIVEEIKKRGMPVDRNSTNIIGNDLRKAHGPGYIAEQLLARAQATGGDGVIESIRSIGEAEFLKSKGALLWAVDADRKVRYERSVARKSDLDKVSFEKFCEMEDLEFANPDPAKHNVLKVIQMADVTLTNNGTPEELYKQVEVALVKQNQ